MVARASEGERSPTDWVWFTTSWTLSVAITRLESVKSGTKVVRSLFIQTACPLGDWRDAEGTKVNIEERRGSYQVQGMLLATIVGSVELLPWIDDCG